MTALDDELAVHRYRTGVETRHVDGVVQYRVVVVRSNLDTSDPHFAYGEWRTDKDDVELHAHELAALLRKETKGIPYMPDPNVLAPGDVIQLDPEKHPYGAMLCVVDEVKVWGVKCYWLQATERGQPPGQCYYRAETGTFERVGKAQWQIVSTG